MRIALYFDKIRVCREAGGRLRAHGRRDDRCAGGQPALRPTECGNLSRRRPSCRNAGGRQRCGGREDGVAENVFTTLDAILKEAKAMPDDVVSGPQSSVRWKAPPAGRQARTE